MELVASCTQDIGVQMASVACSGTGTDLHSSTLQQLSEVGVVICVE